MRTLWPTLVFSTSRNARPVECVESTLRNRAVQIEGGLQAGCTQFAPSADKRTAALRINAARESTLPLPSSACSWVDAKASSPSAELNSFSDTPFNMAPATKAAWWTLT